MHSETMDIDLLPTRASLVLRLKDWDDQESWRDFFNTYWKLIYGVALKSGLSDAAAQDVVQETIISVASRIREFSYDPQAGSFKGWLLTITRRRVIDHFRRQARRPQECVPDSDGTGTPFLHRLPGGGEGSWERMWEEDWEKNLMDAALVNVKRRVKPLQYQLFDCLVLKRWSAQEIKRTLRVSLSQIYFAKHKVSRLVEHEVARLKREWR